MNFPISFSSSADHETPQHPRFGGGVFIWCSILELMRTHFAACGGENLMYFMKNFRKNQKRKRGAVLPSPLVGPSFTEPTGGQIDVFRPVSSSNRKNCVVEILSKSFLGVVVVPQNPAEIVFDSLFHYLVSIHGVLKAFERFVDLEFIQEERDGRSIRFFHQLDSDFLERKSGDDVGVVFDFSREAHMRHLIFRSCAFFVLPTHSADKQEESAGHTASTRLPDGNFFFFHEHLPQLVRRSVKPPDFVKRILVIAAATNREQAHHGQSHQSDHLFHRCSFLFGMYCIESP